MITSLTIAQADLHTALHIQRRKWMSTTHSRRACSARNECVYCSQYRRARVVMHFERTFVSLLQCNNCVNMLARSINCVQAHAWNVANVNPFTAVSPTQTRNMKAYIMLKNRKLWSCECIHFINRLRHRLFSCLTATITLHHDTAHTSCQHAP